MKHFYYCLILFAFIFTSQASAQIIDIDYNFNPEFFPNKLTTQREIGAIPERSTSKMPQLFTSGFINYVSGGNIQASANLLRMNIGNPNKFYIPFYIYAGITGNGLADVAKKTTTINTLLNPVSGTLNLSLNGLQLIGLRTGYTNWKIAYQLGARMSAANDALANKDFTFYNTFANLGLFVQTQAWKNTAPEKVGIFFLQAKAIGMYTQKANLQKVFGNTKLDNHYLVGFAVDAGIEIDKMLAMKFGVYKYTDRHIDSVLNPPVVSFGINYSFLGTTAKAKK
jgi:hypothetical protein